MSSTGDSSPQPPSDGLRARLAAFVARRSDFTVNIAKLSSGTALRTLIAFGSIPIVTRLYVPEDFGDLQLLLSIIATFVAVSTLKYEVAIVLPDAREESDRVAVLCLAVVGIFTVVLAGLAWVFGDWFFGLFDAERLRPFAGLVVLGFLASGVLRTTHFMLIARRRFGGLAKNNVLQMATTQSTYIGLGLWSPSFLGLFAGQLAGHVVAIAHALWQAPFRMAGGNARHLVGLASRYRKFPLVNTPGVFVNHLAYEMPVFLLARYFDADVVGFYMLTDRLLNQPTALIGEAVMKVYLQSAANLRHQGALELRGLFRKTAGRLLAVSAPFALFVAVAAPPLVAVVLGDGYREVGVLMQILVLGRFIEFVASPLISTFSVVNRQEISVALMIVSAIVRLGAMITFSASSHDMLLALSVAIAVFGFVYLASVDILLTRMARQEAERVG